MSGLSTTSATCTKAVVGVDEDDGAAARWYRLAADQGDAHAQNNLCIAYFHGLGVDQNDGEAVR